MSVELLPGTSRPGLRRFGPGLSERSLRRIFASLGIVDQRSERWIESLPFTRNDATAGSEIELQAAVAGSRENVDLPLTIERSNYFANIVKRAASGELSRKTVSDLEQWLVTNDEGIWENSWVRIPARALNAYASRVLSHDLRADKANPGSGMRADSHVFSGSTGRHPYVRVPVSYLLKLSMADAMATYESTAPLLLMIGERQMRHLLNDNTSPESHSFYVATLKPERSLGRELARETSLRFLMMQLLAQYANRQFGLTASGQSTLVYFSPHPPVRQKALNACISDSFYRSLFMSPCLSGWDRGEEKHRYMHLCHQVLSRSQLNAVGKLREAGIIHNNLVVLPSMSNISLANNGIHVTLGSRRLTHCLKDGNTGFNREHEKYIGDLAIKIVEHFLPLFVGAYSAAPYRLGFEDFHPERALGFLPHELDYTHLRMVWRRWQKKAGLKILGQRVGPIGPLGLDRLLCRLFRLRGDVVPDFRLIDYPVALMSTERSPAFDGTTGNQACLKKDLDDLGVFDARMSFYCLYRQRDFANMGFSGFEGRGFSLFADLEEDMGQAVDLQTLVTAYAFKLMAQGAVTHEMIPDTPSVESERRQIFFGAAIGLPTFYIRRDTPNFLLRKIVERAARVRSSQRYPGYWRVHQIEYRKTLLALLTEEAADLVEYMNMGETLKDASARLSGASVADQLMSDVCRDLGVASPLDAPATEFNRAAEHYYRDTLKRKQMGRALDLFEAEVQSILTSEASLPEGFRDLLRSLTGDKDPRGLIQGARGRLLDETASAEELRRLIAWLMTCIDIHRRQSEGG